MDPILTRLLVVAALVAVTTALGRWWQRRDGRVRRTDGAGDHRPELGLDPEHDGPQAVLFGSPTCAPCETVKQLLDRLAADHDGFRWAYRDAAEDLELAAAHHVRRVPTLLVLDGRGSLVARSSGVPDRGELRAVLAEATTSTAQVPTAA